MRRRVATLFALAALFALACAGVGGAPDGPVLRLSEVGGEDPTRRASLRLLVQGLDADAAGRARAALAAYERAMQIDPTNPWAHLVLARHELDGGDARRALASVDQAEAGLAAEGALSPRVETHLAGLRGASLEALGRDGSAELARARAGSPEVWADGRLGADELR